MDLFRLDIDHVLILFILAYLIFGLQRAVGPYRSARRRHDAKVSNSGSATAKFKFSARTLLSMQSTTPSDRPTNWMLTNFGRT
jgi:hypothetical protein